MEGFRIQTVIAFVAVDSEGNEGIMRSKMGSTFYPLICADEIRLALMVPVAEQIKEESGLDYRVLEFSGRKDVTEQILHQFKGKPGAISILKNLQFEEEKNTAGIKVESPGSANGFNTDAAIVEDDLISLPATLAEAIEFILPEFKGFEDVIIDKQLKTEDDFAAFCHSMISGGIGMAIRNQLDLWNSDLPLHQHFIKEHGLEYPDDMSDLIIRGVYAKLKEVTS